MTYVGSRPYCGGCDSNGNNDEERYEGHWLKDKRWGEGVLYFGTCGESFRGKWIDGKKESGAYYDGNGNFVAKYREEDESPNGNNEKSIKCSD
jgi:hypothetical protein